MLVDPSTLTVGGVAKTLARVSVSPTVGMLRSNDGNYIMSTGQQVGKRARRSIRVDYRKVAADPLATGFNKEYSMSTYFVVDVPLVGFTVAEAYTNFAALRDFCTNPIMTQILGGEL